LQIGFLRRTKRGREVTKSACEHLALKYHKKSRTEDRSELFEEKNNSSRASSVPDKNCAF